MLRCLAGVLLALCAGCSPTFNWREVRAEGTPLVAMLPCKPDRAARSVPMVGREVQLQVLGCEAGGATFAVLFADVGDAGRVRDALAQWRQATLANMRASGSQAQPFVPPGALALPEAERVLARGRRGDGSAVQGEAAYFARGSHVFQAVVYADEVRPEWSQPFFDGLKLR